ncbi:MAG: hypothetical protein J3K34DRAFT_133403 [Monoraphidium minutum]|nr:MAG: hypothetical protein J3K34DRAFT_133403 [Monoraphidium minutum]
MASENMHRSPSALVLPPELLCSSKEGSPAATSSGRAPGVGRSALGTPSGACGGAGPLDGAAFSSDAFRMNVYKVVMCPKRTHHDWRLCPFAHPSERARRRPLRGPPFAYGPDMCEATRRGEACPEGDACTNAHSVYEAYLHPLRYRTELCKDGARCSRAVCFFAHGDHELRGAGGSGGAGGQSGGGGQSGAWGPGGGAGAAATGELPRRVSSLTLDLHGVAMSSPSVGSVASLQLLGASPAGPGEPSPVTTSPADSPTIAPHAPGGGALLHLACAELLQMSCSPAAAGPAAGAASPAAACAGLQHAGVLAALLREAAASRQAATAATAAAISANEAARQGADRAAAFVCHFGIAPSLLSAVAADAAAGPTLLAAPPLLGGAGPGPMAAAGAAAWPQAATGLEHLAASGGFCASPDGGAAAMTGAGLGAAPGTSPPFAAAYAACAALSPSSTLAAAHGLDPGLGW